MAKRGQRFSHRVIYVHANGVRGTIVASSLDDAHMRAATPLSVPGCRIAILEVKADGNTTVVETETSPARADEI
jgi:hypothetical protein